MEISKEIEDRIFKIISDDSHSFHWIMNIEILSIEMISSDDYSYKKDDKWYSCNSYYLVNYEFYACHDEDFDDNGNFEETDDKKGVLWAGIDFFLQKRLFEVDEYNLKEKMDKYNKPSTYDY
jgi:hypothetical protein